MSTSRCPECHALVPDSDGPTHGYFGASPGCWAIYGVVLAREYGDPRYMKVHRLTVDAYAVQHPGKPEPRTIQSINVHLLGLYLTLAKKCDPKFVTEAIGRIIEKNKGHFTWLEAPQVAYPITVMDVLGAKEPEKHAEIVRKWAQTTWDSWSAHHDMIAEMAKEVL